MTNAQHTPGPWTKHGLSYLVGPAGQGDFTTTVTVDRPGSALYVASIKQSGARDHNEAEANADLMIAAVNSYDKHFGPNAIAAAEADLLGEMKVALQNAIEALAMCVPCTTHGADSQQAAILEGRALLVKVGRLA